MKERFGLIVGMFLMLCTLTTAQGVIVIDHKTQRYIGETTSLDRSKFVNGHILFNNSDAEFEAFKEEYNLPVNFIGGRQFWNPFGKVKDGVIPNINKKYNGMREVSPYLVATGTASQLMYDDNVDYSIEDVSDLSKQAADYVAKSYRDDWDLVPKYIEPFNEPMVHAIDYYPEGRENPPKYLNDKLDVVITNICNYHKDLGQAIHALPELANMKVVGFGSAYPELENNGFSLWDTRFRKFIDIAGADLDVLSLHLYDGSGINNSGGRRSGSNSEAIIDMIETYSFIKFQKVIPIAITEYGRLVPNQPNWKAGNGQSNYEPVENSQAVRSQIHMVMNFMEREDHLELSIPFNVNTRNPNGQYSKSSIWVKNAQGIAELTNRKYFYEMWKDLKGERVRINSSNVDIQTQAFVNDHELYVMLNNLNDEPQTLDLHLFDAQGLQSVAVKNLKIHLDQEPTLAKTTSDTAPEKITLEYGETVVLTYKFDTPVSFDNTIRSNKYYSATYLQTISADEITSFSFDDVVAGIGLATLRLSVGRAHGKSLKPVITINGQSVDISSDVIRGYDQNSRKQFFGTLEIPFNIDLLKEGSNIVEVKFADGGGHISSVVLQVQNAEKPLDELPDLILESNIPGGQGMNVYPNPIDVGDEVYLGFEAEDVSYSVLTLNGKLISEGKGNLVQTEGLKPGIYLVRATLDFDTLMSKLVVK